MAQAFHFDLTGVGEAALVDQTTDANQVLLLVGALDLVFELVAHVKMVFQRTLAATGDDGDLVEASLECLFNPVLNQWLVHHRQHFLGHCLGSRQEARAVTGSGEQAFLDHGTP